MRVYARIENGKVAELIGETETPLTERFHPSIVATCVELLQNTDVKIGDVYANGFFSKPPPVGTENPALRTYKSDVWRRCTDAEAQALDAALAAATAKLRRLWDDCTILEHEAPEWSLLVAGVAAAVGEERAAEILAPSTL